MKTDFRGDILIAAREQVVAKLKRQLGPLGFRTVIVPSLAAVLEQAATVRPFAVLLDVSSKNQAHTVILARQLRDQFGLPVLLLFGKTSHSFYPNPEFPSLSEPIRARDLQFAFDAIARQRHIEVRLRETEALIQRNQREFTVLSHVGQAVLTSLQPEVVLHQVLDEIFPLLEGADGLSILLRRNQSLVFAAVRGAGEKILVGNEMPADVGVAGRVLQTGDSIHVTESDAHLMYPEIEKLTGYRTRDLIAVPLQVGQTMIGVIEAVHHEAGKFTDEHLQLLQAAGNWAAIAIENARLFNQVETAKKEWEDSVDSLAEGISLVDDEYRIVRSNQTLANWLGTTPQQLQGRFCYEAIDGCDAPPESCPHRQLMRAHENKRQADIEHARLGKTFHFTSYALRQPSGMFQGAVNVLQDLTSERLLQAQLIQSEKLAATGRLAASIAHEINNPLQAIQGCLDLAEANLGDTSKEERYLKMAQGELNRLATIVQRLLAFYRTGKGTNEQLDVSVVIGDILALNAKRLEDANVSVQTEWAENLPRVSIVKDQIQHVFLNLILNAADAMPRGGELKIAGRVVQENWITIAFRDTGVGIAADDLGKIFEPFYTTRTEGTGLGLGISQNILTNLRGRLTVDSVVGKGSTFTVWLPLD